MSDKKEVRVLIADDSPTVVRFAKKYIQKLNYTLIGVAKNGQEAVEITKDQKPDLLLLDINMPIMTGDKALEKIMDCCPETVVIMMTSVSDAGVVEKCLDLGASNFIVKHTDYNEIITTIKETWEMNSFD